MNVSRVDEVQAVVRAALDAVLRADDASGAVLAVSGGRDSMVLLHAAAATAREMVRAVATFDHGTGPHSTQAITLVTNVAQALGIPVVSARASHPGRTEAEWRDARWRFLRECARDVGGAAVAVAHTRDDHSETVVMRALRGASTRGLAGLALPTDGIVRPLVTLSRADVGAYADAHGVHWSDDPSNADRRHLRVRVRAELLPAVDRTRRDAAFRMLELAEHATVHRRAVDDWVARVCGADTIMTESLRSAVPEVPRVRVTTLDALDAHALALFWPAFAARAGVRLDRRGIARLVAFTPRAAARVRDGTVQPACIPVAGTGASGAHAHVALECGARDASTTARAWQFTVRAAPTEPLDETLGMAALRSSDYA